MTRTRFPTLLVLSSILWLAASLGDKNCSITRPGGVKEPGVTNIRGECCSSFYSNSGNWNDCVLPTPDRPGRKIRYLSVERLRREIAKGKFHRRCSHKKPEHLRDG
jgi:hypothetical protein